MEENIFKPLSEYGYPGIISLSFSTIWVIIKETVLSSMAFLSIGIIFIAWSGRTENHQYWKRTKTNSSWVGKILKINRNTFQKTSAPSLTIIWRRHTLGIFSHLALACLPQGRCVKSWEMQFLSLPEDGIHPKVVCDLYEDSLQIHKHCHKLLSTDWEICAMCGKWFFFKWQHINMFFRWLQIHLILGWADSQVISLKGKREYKTIKLWKKGFSSVGYPQ